MDFTRLHGDLLLALLGGGQIIVGIGIGAAVGEDTGKHRKRHKQRRHDEAGLHIELADGRDLGQQLLVLGLVDQIGKQHQQARHQGEHGQQAQQNGLDQHHSHIQADAKVHEGQSAQAGDGGQ